MSLILLLESSLGYCLFNVEEYEEIQQNSEEFLASALDYKTLSSKVNLRATHSFKSAKEALENIKAVTNKEVSDELRSFLETSFPSKKKKYLLGVIDKSLAKQISEDLEIKVEVGSLMVEITRVIRTFLHKFLKVAKEDIDKASLGLGHQYSRMKCMFDVNREDKPVIQSIALIDQLDKNINSFCMRIKEWFGWHFPELSRIVTDNSTYAKVVNIIQSKDELIKTGGDSDNELFQKVLEAVVEQDIATQVYEAACNSMGSELNEIDTINVKLFCSKVLSLINYREGLGGYLKDKMKVLAPNTSTLIGETLSARLISHSGSLSNLAKYPASTIQILGAEKALFRALKARSNKTPKYGLLYHSNYIGKAIPKNKGKISRYLANKIAQSSRIDFFTEERDDIYGQEFKKQVDERMRFLVTGDKPRKNIDVMKEAKNKNGLQDGDSDEDEVKVKKTSKKRKQSNVSSEVEKKVKKSKKSKKAKEVDSDSD